MGAFYILLTAFAVALAWFGRSGAAIRCGHWLLFSCATSNLAVDAMGFLNAPMLIPALDAFVALVGILPIALALEVHLPDWILARCGQKTLVALEFLGLAGKPVSHEKSKAAMVIFAIFVAVGFVHAVAYTTHRQGTFGYYGTLNLLFAAQVLVVGGVGGYRYLSRRPDPSVHLLGSTPEGR